MKKVCLIETESHHEVIRNFMCSIIEYCEVTVVTNTFCEEALRPYAHDHLTIINYEVDKFNATTVLVQGVFDYRLTITPPSWKFFRKHKEWFRGSDLLIHNMNYWFLPLSNVYFFRNPSLKSITSLFRFIKYLPSLFLKRKNYLSFFMSFIAPSRDLFLKFNQFEKLRTYLRLDYNLLKPETNTKPFFQIAIPGSVNHSRNYEELLTALRELSQENSIHIKVFLLGANKSKLKFSSYETDKLTVFTFNNSVPEKEFIDCLKSSDLGILPLKKEIDYMGVFERKGETNISGGVYDFVFVGIKGLIPKSYSENLPKNISIYKDTNDLKEKIFNFINLRNEALKSNFSNQQISKENFENVICS